MAPGPSLFNEVERVPEIIASPEIEQPAVVEEKKVVEVVIEQKIEPNKVEAPVVKEQAPASGTVKLISGEILSIGDECIVVDDVLTGLLKDAHKDKTFIIEKMTPWVYCTSGMLVIAYQKDDPEKKTTGVGEKGIDANWFKKVQS